MFQEELREEIRDLGGMQGLVKCLQSTNSKVAAWAAAAVNNLGADGS